MLQLRKLTVSIGKKKILTSIDFSFEKNKIYAVMGPNGSGKSTLAYTIMGHPAYAVGKSSKILMEKKDVTDMSPDKRAEMGIFLSFQQPLSLAGVRVSELLHLALTGKKDPLKIRQQTQTYARELDIKPELLERSLNEGASGGEKKKMEVLQAAVLDKKLLIFDEVDTGVDVDALKTISHFLKKHRKGKTYIVITHYNRILRYLKPDKILILKNGKLAAVGDHRLADRIEKKGYESIKS